MTGNSVQYSSSPLIPVGGVLRKPQMIQFASLNPFEHSTTSDITTEKPKNKVIYSFKVKQSYLLRRMLIKRTVISRPNLNDNTSISLKVLQTSSTASSVSANDILGTKNEKCLRNLIKSSQHRKTCLQMSAGKNQKISSKTPTEKAYLANENSKGKLLKHATILTKTTNPISKILWKFPSKLADIIENSVKRSFKTSDKFKEFILSPHETVNKNLPREDQPKCIRNIIFSAGWQIFMLFLRIRTPLEKSKNEAERAKVDEPYG